MGWKKKLKHINQIKKKLNADMKDCGSFKSFGYIYIYIYIDYGMIIFNYKYNQN